MQRVVMGKAKEKNRLPTRVTETGNGQIYTVDLRCTTRMRRTVWTSGNIDRQNHRFSISCRVVRSTDEIPHTRCCSDRRLFQRSQPSNTSMATFHINVIKQEANRSKTQLVHGQRHPVKGRGRAQLIKLWIRYFKSINIKYWTRN